MSYDMPRYQVHISTLTEQDVSQSVYLHATFAFVTAMLTYNFYKAWRGDPGYLSSNREDKIKVNMHCQGHIALPHLLLLEDVQLCSTV